MPDLINDTQKKVLCFGEVLWDILPFGPLLGGAPLNFAYRLNSLGGTALLATRVGADEWGDRILSEMQRLSMDTALVQRDPEHVTGIVNVDLSDATSPRYTIVTDVAYDYIEPTPALSLAASRADCIYFGSLSQRWEPKSARRRKLTATRGST